MVGIALPRDVIVTAPCTPGTYTWSLRFRAGGWSTPPLPIERVEQPVVVPPGTPPRAANLLLQVADEPPGSAMWEVTMEVSPFLQDLVAMKDAAVPLLVANLHVCRLETRIARALAAAAVPTLVDRLWMEDTTHDRILLTALAKIAGDEPPRAAHVGHPRRASSHRRAVRATVTQGA